ncbi:hypothetical protein F7725_027306 [Dissostichus mawsoni]|uniref:Transmembrane protein 131 n=1 Tax=Dissostichus mawsoni TaxID=36200 RepID=A0A7J5XEL1_DISMA|nr:hypothetical protein F7725_027306 [Dissostichus mawsoni]
MLGVIDSQQRFTRPDLLTRSVCCRNSEETASMASQQRAQSQTRRRAPCIGLLRMIFIAFIHMTRANKQAFIQSDTILEVLHFGEGSLLQAESDIDFSLYHQQSTSPQRGNCRPIRFEPPMLDFHEQPVGMPKMEKVYLHNPSAEEISLISISATTAHFHASFFQNRIIPPGGNTSFDVVFLARVVGNVENTLFINTSHHGVFTYQVFGVGIPNPYRLRPFIGARVPVNSSFSPLINIHNPYSEPLQVVEMYSSGGDLHLELPTAPGIYSSTEMLDFGTLRSQECSDDAIKRSASKARRSYQFSGKITVKAKEKSYSKLEIPYQAEVLDGYLGFDHTATLFHIRDSPVDPVDRPIFLTNAFGFAIRIHNAQNFSAPILIPAHESRYIFSLLFRPVRPSIHIDSNILLITNASKFHLPVRAYTGFLEPLVLPPSLKENILDFGVRSATDTSSIIFVVVNSNPIELEIKSWLVTGDSISMELLKTEKGNATVALNRLRELQNISASSHKTVILASGYYAAFRVTLVAKALEGLYDGAIHITTDYEILTIPVKALIASSFTQKVRLQQIRSLTEDIRFYYKRLRNNKDELEPRRKSKVLPLALLPNPSVFSGKLADRLPLGNLSNINIDTSTLEFQVHRNQTSLIKSSSGFVEGSTRPFVYNLLLLPGEIKAFNVRFTPTSNHSVSSLLIVRNNLTVIDTIILHGRGTTESLKVAGKPPGQGSSLRFKMTEALLKDCTEKTKVREPNFTLKRTFRVENTGLLPITIRFTPDFTSSRVIRELKLVTCGGSEFVFVLNASLPYHMLATCAETLPRPGWELELYIIVSMFLLVIATAYLEAQSIWEPFKRRVSVETNSTMETGRPLNDYGDPPQRVYSSSNGASRIGGRQGNSRTFPDSESQDKRSRLGFSRPSMPASSSSSSSSSSQLSKDPPVFQLTNRKARSSKQPELQGFPGSALPHRGSDGSDEYNSLIGAMDNDLDRPEPLGAAETLQEQSVQAVQIKVLDSKGKLRGKTKAQKKKEEKEKKSLVKPQGDELKENGADNDDSSSTTTETSNPDTEANSKEEPVKKKGRTVTTGKNKQRKSFTSKTLHPLSNIPKSRPLQKQQRFDGKLEEGRPSLLAKLLSSVPVGELGHSSSSEGEKEFAAPEWDIPLSKNSVQADSLQQISLQTINADPFLKRSATAGTCSPPPASPVLLSRGSYSSVLNSNSELNQKKAPGNKLSPATPLPGKNGNPTFAAVAAGYDKSPGTSGLWSPLETASSPNFHSANSFSAFGPNNSFNLTGVFSGMNLPKPTEPQPQPQQSWPEFSSASSSIWSTSADSALHPFPPASNSSSTLTDLVSPVTPSPPPSEMSRTYNPWSMWRPTLSRRSSEPWPSSSDNNNNNN